MCVSVGASLCVYVYVREGVKSMFVCKMCLYVCVHVCVHVHVCVCVCVELLMHVYKSVLVFVFAVWYSQ